MGIASDLRESVLQAAIQGKLTEQLASDGNARDLLKRIEAEKDKLIADKKIKKEKTLAPISDDEKPFDIPDNWEWCYLQNIVNIRSAVRIHQSDWRKSGVPFYRAREIVKLSKQGYVDNELFIDRDKYEEYKKSSGVPIKGDLMVSGVGTLGASYVVKDTDEFYYKDASVLCFENRFGINPYYLQNLLATPFMMSQIYSSDAYGTTVATLTMDRAYGFLVPLPPLAEQERIVAKVDELMKEIDELEKIENELESIKKAFPDDMKSALLQAAMKGELTERLVTDGTAKELLDKIGVKPITDTSDMPFDIPDGWEWCRLDDVCTYISTGNSISENIKKDKYMKTIPNGLSYIGTKDVGFDGVVDYDNGVMIPLKEPKFRVAKTKSTLLCIEGGSAGKKIAIIDRDVCYGNKLCAFTFNDEFNAKFLHYWLQTPAFLKMFNGDVSGMIGGVSQKKIKEFIIPIPPLAEQERIVAQLDKLLPLCESLS